MGAPWAPMWPAGLPAGWKSSFHFSRCYFSQTETQNLARDLANGVSECILDPFSRLLQTILYRTDRRRAHHHPPDHNIFNGHNRFLLSSPFSGGSKILIFPRCYFWQKGGIVGHMGRCQLQSHWYSPFPHTQDPYDPISSPKLPHPLASWPGNA